MGRGRSIDRSINVSNRLRERDDCSGRAGVVADAPRTTKRCRAFGIDLRRSVNIDRTSAGE